MELNCLLYFLSIVLLHFNKQLIKKKFNFFIAIIFYINQSLGNFLHYFFLCFSVPPTRFTSSAHSKTRHKVRENGPWGRDSPCQDGLCTAHLSKMYVPNYGKLSKWASGDLFIDKGQQVKS